VAKSAGILILGLSLGLRAWASDHPKVSSKETPKTEQPNTKAAQLFVNRVACEGLPQKTESEQWGMAECFFKIGVYSKAVEILREISRKNPKDLEAYFNASWMLWTDGHALGGEDEKKKNMEAVEELQRARISNPTHWEVDTELGDFYLLRLNLPQKAYTEYIKAREHYEGDYSRSVPKAENGRKAAIEDRIGRVAELLDNKGEAVEASCRALFFDPDDKAAENRINKIGGSCIRKKVKDPTKGENTKTEKKE